jgi:hypothetical protein
VLQGFFICTALVLLFRVCIETLIFDSEHRTMKKLLYLFLAITIISCGGDDDRNTNNNSNNLTINPPSWIQGTYLQDIGGQTISNGYEFKSNDFCGVTSNISSCYKAQLDLYESTPNFETDVYEEVDNNRYFIEITLGPTIYSFEFEKVSNTSIKQILPTGEITYILQ